jgi:hypothetical protein
MLPDVVFVKKAAPRTRTIAFESRYKQVAARRVFHSKSRFCVNLGFVSGHDLSRAESGENSDGALAPANAYLPTLGFCSG